MLTDAAFFRLVILTLTITITGGLHLDKHSFTTGNRLVSAMLPEMDEQVEADLPASLLQALMTLQSGHNRHQGGEDEDLDQQQWLFILGTGRSGSTSILEMVNAIPGFFLAGENDGIMSEFLHLMKHRESQKERQLFSAWQSGNVSEQRLLHILQAYTREIIGWNGEHPHTVGFKEIRHTDKEELDLFLKVFPNAKFIISTGTPSRQAQSYMHQNMIGNNLTQLEEMNQHLADWGRKQSDRAFMLPLDEFSVARFNEMLDWLGVNNCRYTRVAHANGVGDMFSPVANQDPSIMPGIQCGPLSDLGT